jgi:hypothetical protein
MKFTDETIQIMQAMGAMNEHLVINGGDKISSLSERRNRMMEVHLNDSFPVPFALHSLSGFLRQLSLFDEPEFEFGENSMIITDQFGAKSDYFYSNKEDLVYMRKELPELTIAHEFRLPAVALDKVLRAAAANKVEDIAFVGEDGGVFIKALDKENPKRVFSVRLGDTDQQFEVFLKHGKKNKLTLMPLSYIVRLSDNGLIKLTGLFGEKNDIKVTYIMAAER